MTIDLAEEFVPAPASPQKIASLLENTVPGF
jgi:hypothetical protein